MKRKIFLFFLLVIVLGHNLLFGQSEIKYIETDTGQIFYEIYGKGTPVILLSGGPGAPPQSMTPIAEYVSKHNRWNIENKIKETTIPILIINRKTDPIGTDIPTKMHQKIKHSLLYLMDNCGHYVWMEKPAELKDIILSFLYRHKN